MREHGIRRIITRDTDFHRFPFLEPVDPLVRNAEARPAAGLEGAGATARQ
jgi:hypothetical protein